MTHCRKHACNIPVKCTQEYLGQLFHISYLTAVIIKNPLFPGIYVQNKPAVQIGFRLSSLSDSDLQIN